ncbi:GAD domain-containing protein, partial [Listeria monocytogenes]|uniref:GAD domain-containing protein n=1 Tax=Listeria monocytogenes TaxID=1639 RepID=UPI003FA40BB0
IENGGEVKAINAKAAASNFSRKDLDALGVFVANYVAKGLAWLKVEAGELKGPMAKLFPEDKAAELKVALQA